jgi:hypothetical protein
MRLLWALGVVRADIDNVFPEEYVTNPVARHVAYSVPANTPTVCTLYGFENSNNVLTFYIQTLPASGKLYETSQNYRSSGTDPKNTPNPIEEHQLPFEITDSGHRVVYAPPDNVFPPEGRWASFTYVVKDPSTAVVSEPGFCGLANPEQNIAESSFVSGPDGWEILGNVNQVEPVHQPYGWGLLNRYVYGTDDVQYIDFKTGYDRKKWYFVAPQSWYLPDIASAYDGQLRFTVKSTYGDFSYLNDPLDWVSLECDKCNNGNGLRIIRFTDNLLKWDGNEQQVSLTLAAGQLWKFDPLNTALPYRDATECEIAAVLSGLTRLKILGDFTQAGEGVAIYDVTIAIAPTMPRFPAPCQQGCPCHHANIQRLSCCGTTIA